MNYQLQVRTNYNRGSGWIRGPWYSSYALAVREAVVSMNRPGNVRHVRIMNEDRERIGGVFHFDTDQSLAGTRDPGV